MPAPRMGNYPQYGGPVHGHPGFAPSALPMPPLVQWRPMPHPGYGMPLGRSSSDTDRIVEAFECGAGEFKLQSAEFEKTKSERI